MFRADRTDIERILRDFGIGAALADVAELERYPYERKDPASREVRLIMKARLETGASLVIRFKNEADVTMETIESQCRFASELRQSGIVTPRQYQSEGAFAREYTIGGYDVIVTVERFVEGQIKVVDAGIAEKTGALLARTHQIAETRDLHVSNPVLFDPFAENDLFDFGAFHSLGADLSGEDRALFDRIVERYEAYMEFLRPLRGQARYAVQGDISDCNLYQTPSGEIGMFDFNRCGDNVLFCDAVMQGLFEARLMDYPEDGGDDREEAILAAFWKGYRAVRAISEEQRRWYPFLHAVIDAFWSMDVKWREDSLLNAARRGDREKTREWLETIWERIARPRLDWSALFCPSSAGDEKTKEKGSFPA